LLFRLLRPAVFGFSPCSMRSVDRPRRVDGLNIVHHRRPIAVAGVMATNNAAVAPVIRRAGSGYLRTLMLASSLGRARATASLAPIDAWEEQPISTPTGLHGRQEFILRRQTAFPLHRAGPTLWACGRGTLEGRDLTGKTPRYRQRRGPKSRLAHSTKQEARAKDNL
jgi:hypothetical protein